MIKLSVPNQTTTFKKLNDRMVDVKVLVLYPYFVEADANGNSFNITDKDIRAIHDVHNKSVRSLWSKLAKMGKNVPVRDIEAIPNKKDHAHGIDSTVGHVLGEFELVEQEGGPYMFATLRVKGKENVDKVEDKIFSKVSIGFEPLNHKTHEISWVDVGAIPHAGNISFSEGIADLSQNDCKIYNTANINRVKTILLTQFENNVKKQNEVENEKDISKCLTNLLIDAKILPKDVLRIKSELGKMPDHPSRLSALSLMENNFRNVIDYTVLSRNNFARDFQGDRKMADKSGKLDMESIVERSAILLKKGAKLEGKEPADNNEEEKKRIEKEEKKESKKSSEFKKKDMKHARELAESGDMEEMCNYLSAFLSDEEQEDMDEKAEKKEEKQKAKMSADIVKLDSQIIELRKQNTEILSQLTLIGKDSAEARAAFSKVQELLNTSK